QNMVASRRLRTRDARFLRHHADNGCAEMLCPRGEQLSERTCGSVQQDDRPRPDRKRALDEVLSGDALEHHGSRVLETDGVWELHQTICGVQPPRRVATQGAKGISDPITDHNILDVRANRGDDPCRLQSKSVRQWNRNGPVALRHIEIVDADGMWSTQAWPGPGADCSNCSSWRT